MSPRIVYSTDPEPTALCERCGRSPCVCHAIDLLPRQQTAYIKRDRKGRAGKTVTVIYGLQHTPATYQRLLADLKAHCGAGGALKESQMEIQGDQREKVAERLRALGYKVKMAGG